MSQLIERLKEGLAEAQKRHAENTKRFQATQIEFNASNAEVQGYIKVIELESRRELEKAATAPSEPLQREPDAEQESINKTQVVKDALAEHPGLTPAQLWGAVKGSIPKREYVYSVLKRLKDRKQIVERRGKYYLPATQKAEEVTPEQLLQ